MLTWVAAEVNAALASLERGNTESAKATLRDVAESLAQVGEPRTIDGTAG